MIEWIVRKILFASLEPQVLVVGMEGSGKRTFEQLLNPPGGGGITTKSILTGSSNQEHTFNQDGVDFSLSSYGGNASMIWYADRGNAGVICVVDSSDEAKIEMTKVAMEWFFERYERLLRKAVLLVLANKQDRLNALSVTEVKERLELETRFEGRRWHIQGIDAVSGLGVKEGLDWMTRQI
ncbi:Arf GTPase arf1 [Linnemannia elongata]|nr:Arf GTPase arf1 [Linnemannia elongata]